MPGRIVVLLVVFLTTIEAYIQDVCMAETFQAECSANEVVVMDTAQYGRMETGRCIKEGSGNIGCTNDVLGLLDKWCSGQRQCEFMPLLEFAKEKTQWCGDLISYFQADFTCLSVEQQSFSYCTSNQKVALTNGEGFLANHITDQTGCGSPKVPWVIKAKPGQLINITLLDFSALSRSESDRYDMCTVVYGYIVERQLGVNKTICGGSVRRQLIYQSKSNVVELQVLPAHQRSGDDRFLLRYETTGCSDLTPPVNAWYKRSGNKATIGCDNSDRVWHLQCQNNAWQGVVGNCSVVAAASTEKKDDFPMFTVLMLSCIIAVTVFLSLVILGVGICFLRRYRRRRQAQANQSTLHPTIKTSDPVTLKTQPYYRPMSYSGTTCARCTKPHDQPQRKSHPNTESSSHYSNIQELNMADNKQVHASDSDYLAPSSNTMDSSQTLPPGGALILGSNALDEDNISSYYSPNTGHKYYVLERNASQL